MEGISGPRPWAARPRGSRGRWLALRSGRERGRGGGARARPTLGREGRLGGQRLKVGNHTDVGAGVRVVGHAAQRVEVVVAGGDGNDDSLLTRGGELGVHEDAGHATVAVRERVDLGDQEHREHGSVEAGGEAVVEAEAFAKSAFDEAWFHEVGRAGTVGVELEGAGADLRPLGKHRCVLGQQDGDEFIGVARGAAPLPGVRDEPVGTEDVVGVLRPLLRHHALENDAVCLVERELRSLDEVGEVGLEERKRVQLVLGIGGQLRRRDALQVLVELLEARDSSRVEGSARRACPTSSSLEVALPSAAQCAYEPVEASKLVFRIELRRDRARGVAQIVERGLPQLSELVEARLDLGRLQGARQALARARRTHVLQEGPRLRAHVEVFAHPGRVAVDRSLADARPEPQSRHPLLPPGVGGERHRAVPGRAVLESRPVDDDGAREVAGRDPGPVAPRHGFRGVGEVLRVEPRTQPTNVTLIQARANRTTRTRRAEEDLRLVVERKSGHKR